VGCKKTRRGNRSAYGRAPQRCVGPNIHDPRSTIGSRGFTLVELLVVIAVISLLMAILVPVVGRARRQARALVCRSTLRQWGQILAAYTTEHNGRLGCGHTEEMVALSLFRGTMPVEHRDLDLRPVRLSVDTEPIRCCPTADEPPPETSGVAYVYRREEDGSETLLMKYRHTNGTFGSWETFYPSPPLYGSYGFNSRLLRGDFAPLWAHTRRHIDG